MVRERPCFTFEPKVMKHMTLYDPASLPWWASPSRLRGPPQTESLLRSDLQHNTVQHLSSGASSTGACGSLTLISDVRGQKVALLPVGTATEPPAVVVLVKHVDDVAAAHGQLVGPVGFVVAERDDLEEGTRRRGFLNVTKVKRSRAKAVGTYDLLNRVWFHVDAGRNVVRAALVEGNYVSWILQRQL